MVRSAGIEHPADAGHLGQSVGDLRGRGRLGGDADRQGFQPLQQHPGVERRQGRAGLAQQVMDVLVDEGLAGQDHAAEAASLPVDMLRRRIDDAVGAELERALQQRRGEDVVDHQRGAARMGDLCHGGDVVDVERRVGGRFQEQRHGVGAERRPPLVEIVAVDQRAFHAEARQQILDDVATGAEQGLGGHHMVARLDLPHQRGRHGGHAGGRGARVLGAFEQRHALLEHPHGGVREARVDEPGILALEASLGGLGRVVDEALRQEERLRRLAEGRADGAAMDEAGGGAEGGELVGHGGLTLHRGLVIRLSRRVARGWTD